MTTAHAEKRELMQKVHAARHEGTAVYEYLKFRRHEINERWVNLTGDDLTLAQGAAREINKMLKIIEQGPAITTTEGNDK